jgi:hypothetical protein
MKKIKRHHKGIALLVALLSGGGLQAWLLRNTKQGNSCHDVGSRMIEYSS